jgi:hypothetical protein
LYRYLFHFLFGNDEQDNDSERQRLENKKKKIENTSIMSSNSNHKDNIQYITTVVAIAFTHIFVVKMLRKKKIEQTFKRHTHASRSTSLMNSSDEEKKEEYPEIADL